MALKCNIEWTTASWNPITGCSKVSEGCLNCYAERMALRLKAAGVPKYRNGFKITFHPSEIEKPLKWKTPQIIFVNSMSDLFHEEVRFEWIESIFNTMNKAHRHIFQILTKRSNRLRELAPHLRWTPNIWIGVTVESPRHFYRIDDLLSVKEASVRFLSLEPLLADMKGLENYLSTGEIDWVIVGGETGARARPMKKEWVLKIRDMCREYGVPFFFKQWGGRKGKGGREIDGVTYNEMPQLREHEQFSLSFSP